jgi:hypothetical protein
MSGVGGVGLPSELEAMYEPILKRADKIGYGQTTTQDHPELLVNALTQKANLELGIAQLKTDTALKISDIQARNSIAMSQLDLENKKFEYMKEYNTPSFGERLMGVATGALEGFVAGNNFGGGSTTGKVVGAIAGASLSGASSGTRAGMENSMGMLNNVAQLSFTYKAQKDADAAKDATKTLMDQLRGLNSASKGTQGTPVSPDPTGINPSLANPQPGAGMDPAQAHETKQRILDQYQATWTPVVGPEKASAMRSQMEKSTLDPLNPLENPHAQVAQTFTRLQQYKSLSNPTELDYAKLQHDLQGIELQDPATLKNVSPEALRAWSDAGKSLAEGKIPGPKSTSPSPVMQGGNASPGIRRPPSAPQMASPEPTHQSNALEIEQLDGQGHVVQTFRPGEAASPAAPTQQMGGAASPSAPPAPAVPNQEQTLSEMEKLRQPMGFWDRGSQGMPFGLETDKARVNRQIDEAEKAVKEGKTTQAQAPSKVDLENKLTQLRQGNQVANRAAENPGVKEDREAVVGQLESVKKKIELMPENNMAQGNEKKGLQRAVEATRNLSNVMEQMPDDLAQRASSFFKDHPILSSPHFKSDFLDAITKEAGKEGTKQAFTPAEQDTIIKYQKQMRDLAYADALIDAGPKAPREDSIKESMKDVPGLEDDYRTRSRKLEELARGYIEDINDRSSGRGGANQKEALDISYRRMRNAALAQKLKGGGVGGSTDLFGQSRGRSTTAFQTQGWTPRDTSDEEDSGD